MRNSIPDKAFHGRPQRASPRPDTLNGWPLGTQEANDVCRNELEPPSVFNPASTQQSPPACESLSKHLIILPYYCEEEVRRFFRLAYILASFGDLKGRIEFLLSARYDFNESRELYQLFSQIAPTRSFRCSSEGKGIKAPTEGMKIEGPTAMFWDTMTFIEKNYAQDGGFALWMEADMVPLRRDWLEALCAEWRRDLSLMGFYVEPLKGQKHVAHINGGACYSKDFIKKVSLKELDLTRSWDVEMFPFLSRAGVPYKCINALMEFRYKTPTLEHTPDAKVAILHGIKDFSAHEYVEKKYAMAPCSEIFIQGRESCFLEMRQRIQALCRNEMRGERDSADFIIRGFQGLSRRLDHLTKAVNEMSAPFPQSLDAISAAPNSSTAYGLVMKESLTHKHSAWEQISANVKRRPGDGNNPEVVVCDAYWQRPAATEEKAFRQCCRFLLDAKGVIYLGFPWATLIDQLHCGDSRSGKLMEELALCRGLVKGFRKVVTTCQHVYLFKFLDLFKEAGVTTIFWSHATTTSQEEADACDCRISIRPFPLLPVCYREPLYADEMLSKAKLLYSFAGAKPSVRYRTECRKWIFESLRSDPRGCVKLREDWHFGRQVYGGKQVKGICNYSTDEVASAKEEAAKEDEFLRLITSSLFTLCPSGTGPNSIRLWEAIMSGSIPVLMADGLVLPGCPKLWERACLILKESIEEIRDIPKRLREEEQQTEKMKERFEALEQLRVLYGPKYFVHDIVKYYAQGSSAEAVERKVLLTPMKGGAVKPLQDAYEEQYTDTMTEWREIGGKHKARNILKVCKGHKFIKVLECGAGEGSILKFLDASEAISELFAIEISGSGISQIRKRNLSKLKEVKRFNGYEIPYLDKEFDMAYCSHVLEHVEHPRKLLRELKRVSSFQVFEIPLDYSKKVDRNVKKFLSFGHINIYTPSLFKFLLKSEGYQILAEHLSHTSEEVLRFNMERNMQMKKSFYRDLTLKLRPLRYWLDRIKYGEDYFEEYGYSAYTCLAKGVGTLKIL